ICVPPHGIRRERAVRPSGVVLGLQRSAQSRSGPLWRVLLSSRQSGNLPSVEPAYKLDRKRRTTEREIRSLQLVTVPDLEQTRSFDPRYGGETTPEKTKLEPPVSLQ